MQLVLDVFVGIVVTILTGYLFLVVRRRLILRVGGTLDCSLREDIPDRTRAMGKGWMLGIARYHQDTLVWFRLFSLSPRPRQVLNRRDVDVRGRRDPSATESLALLSGAVVLECVVQGRTIELALTEDALTGFLSWLEAAPPGQHLDVA